jgi:hypothetical protein
MDRLRIFVDLGMPPDVLHLLRTETAGHELILPQTPVSSVLAKADPDPHFGTADIAFGQPDPRAIADALSLKWIHISSSGITRYDNPEFRALMAGRQIVVAKCKSARNLRKSNHPPHPSPLPRWPVPSAWTLSALARPRPGMVRMCKPKPTPSTSATAARQPSALRAPARIGRLNTRTPAQAEVPAAVP